VIDLARYQTTYNAKIYRIVESQEKVATMQLVDTLDEQVLLEELIEATKPTISNKHSHHYLIYTPFRYPPLKHGSRFGTRYEKSIFYAGKTLESALCESAFYSFYFLSRMSTPYREPIINHKTSFFVILQSNHHIDLTQIEDCSIRKQINHKEDYTFPQALGNLMRKRGVQSFSYFSARCHEKVNIGVFDIDAISSKPIERLHWELKQTQTTISFLCLQKPEHNIAFNIDLFLVNDSLPHPSN